MRITDRGGFKNNTRVVEPTITALFNFQLKRRSTTCKKIVMRQADRQTETSDANYEARKAL